MRNFICSVLAICVIGCTTMRPIDVPNAPETPALHVGDKVHIVAKDGRMYTLEITAIERDGFRGKNDRGEGRLRYADVKSIQVEQVSWWKVGGWTAAGLATLWVTLVLVAIETFKHAF